MTLVAALGTARPGRLGPRQGPRRHSAAPDAPTGTTKSRTSRRKGEQQKSMAQFACMIVSADRPMICQVVT